LEYRVKDLESTLRAEKIEKQYLEEELTRIRTNNASKIKTKQTHV